MGKVFISLIVIALIMASVIGCGPNRQIVIGENVPGGFHTIWQAYVGQDVTIEGSAFPYNSTVFITICALYWTQAEANLCGAFRIDTTIPSIPDLFLPGPVSVEAWIDDGDGVLEYDEDEQQTSWPLYLYEESAYLLDQAINGDLYTVTDSGINHVLHRSNTGGVTFAPTSASMATPIVDICCSPIFANIVYFATATDVYKYDASLNTFTQLLPNLFTALGLTSGSITSIDVAYIGADDPYVFVGVSDFAPGGDGGAYVYRESAASWQDLLIDTYRPPTPNGWGDGTADVYDIRADPNNFATTQAVMAIARYDGTNATFWATPFTVFTTRHLGYQWNSFVGDAAFLAGNVAGNYITDLYRATMWLPDDFDYSLLPVGGMELFVGIASFVATEGDVYQVIGGVPNPAIPPIPGSFPFDLNIGWPSTSVDIIDLDGDGIYGYIFLLAGTAVGNVCIRTPSLLTFSASLPTTGIDATYVVVDLNFSISHEVWAMVHGFDGGLSWSELSGAIGSWSQIWP
jgi:hypothetical protein